MSLFQERDLEALQENNCLVINGPHIHVIYIFKDAVRVGEAIQFCTFGLAGFASLRLGLVAPWVGPC